jgi:Tol biopolymer transport system component
MATVYLAEDLRHRRRVAIKVLHPELSAVLGPERFLREIELTASLQHPHILPLFDSGAADGLLYYVMPYIEGETLRSRLARENQLSVANAVRIAGDVADALEYAHKRGVVHRDIKPENILLHEGRPQVADFGIALAVQQAGGSRMTHTGMSLGTPQYMAPEQALGEKVVDARADIYALGVVTYEMLAGEPPFTGASVQAIVAKVMNDAAVPLSTQRRSVTPELEATVMTALEKLPADRFATAADFARALRNEPGATAVSWPSAGGGRTAPRPARLLPIAGLVAGGAALGAVAGWLGRPRQHAEPMAAIRFEIPADSAHPIELNCCAAIFAISPDGRTVVFQSREPEDTLHGLYARELSSVARRPIAGTAGFPRGPFFSPDGSQLGFQTVRSIRTVPLMGGEAITVTQLPPGFYAGGTWTNDGRIIFATRSLFAVDARGGTPQLLISPDSARGEREFHMPHFIAGANAVLFGVTYEGKSPEVRMLWLGNRRVKSITLGVTPSYVVPGSWLLVVRADGRLDALPFDPESGDTTGAPVRLAEGVQLQSPVAAYAEYAASPGGTIVRVAPVSSGRGPVVQVGNGRGVPEALRLPIQAEHLDQPRISPDGRRLAIVAADASTQLHSIFVYDFGSLSAVRLTASGDRFLSSWTSDGDSLMTVTRDGLLTIMPADRSDAERELGTLKGWTGIRSLNVRGAWVAFGGTAASGAMVDLGVFRRDSAGSPRVYAASILADDDPAISPDGKWLAYDANDTGRSQVYVSALPQAARRIPVSEDGGIEPRWSRDGRELYYRKDDRIIAATLAPGAAFQITGRREVAKFSVPVARGDWDIDPTRPRTFWVESAILGRTPLLVELNVLPRKLAR